MAKESSQALLSTDRTWPLPKWPWVMRMGWHDLLFAHWKVDAKNLAKHIPAGLQLDVYHGEAWIGIVPFRMSQVAPRMIPAIPGMSNFPELNVRTYVRCDGKPGVFFFSLDATNLIAVRVARRAFYLPYMDAKISIHRSDESAFEYQSERTHRDEPPARFVATYRPTSDAWTATPDTLEHWLTARYCLYSVDRRGRIFRGEIRHPPWSLQDATCEIRENTMCDSLELPLIGEPHLLFARDTHVHAWLIHRCG